MVAMISLYSPISTRIVEANFDPNDDTLSDDIVILLWKLLNVHRLISNIESLKVNSTPDRALESPSSFPISVVDSDSFFEDYRTIPSHLPPVLFSICHLPEALLFLVHGSGGNDFDTAPSPLRANGILIGMELSCALNVNPKLMKAD
ncbi:hypothetical protein Tco_1029970 [Tanacetum coccineum]|uniref:Uncharacterized protein n=1 Tax=Tanacetum coccineum TaxID=301880 RepID=A0ABQ5G6N2_9ASTR